MNKEIIIAEINVIVKKVFGHKHKAIKNQSVEWLKRELRYLKEIYK